LGTTAPRIAAPTLSQREHARRAVAVTKPIAALSVCMLLVAASGAAYAKIDPVAKCSGAKRKAAGKKGGSLLACHAKAIGKGSTTPDTKCTSKAVSSFEAAFDKADSKGPCPGTTAEIEALVDACVGDVIGRTNGETGKCAGGKVKGAAKDLSGQLGCHAKQSTKPDPVGFDECVAKAHAKIEKVVGKADEAKDGPCAGIVGTLEGIVDACTQTIAGATPPVVTGSSTSTTTTPSTSTSTSSSVPGSTSTSTSSTTTTTSTTIGSSSTTSTSTSTTSTSTTLAAVCGNGVTESGETCDDHNTVDESDPQVPIIPTDNCPKNCTIGFCGAGTQTAQTVAVDFATLPGAPQLFGITIFVNYPDAKADLPGSGSGVIASISNVNPGALNQPNDLDYGLLDGLVSLSGLTGSKLFDLTLQRCPGQPPMAAGDFTCLVKDASDQGGSPVAGVTCSVVP
jgi:hypothetical protein